MFIYSLNVLSFKPVATWPAGVGKRHGPFNESILFKKSFPTVRSQQRQLHVSYVKLSGFRKSDL